MKTLKDTFTRSELTDLIHDIEAGTANPLEVIGTDSTVKLVMTTPKGKKVTILLAVSMDSKVYAVQAHSKLFPANCYWSAAA